MSSDGSSKASNQMESQERMHSIGSSALTHHPMRRPSVRDALLIIVPKSRSSPAEHAPPEVAIQQNALSMPQHTHGRNNGVGKVCGTLQQPGTKCGNHCGNPACHCVTFGLPSEKLMTLASSLRLFCLFFVLFFSDCFAFFQILVQ